MATGLFYLNVWVLIPRILERKGLLTYLLFIGGLLLLIVVGTFGLTVGMIPPGTTGFRPIVLLPAVLVLSVSTSYKVLTDYYRREQLRKEEENERLKSELSFLRSQISPHFLFNILNSIVSLARLRPEAVEPVTIQLAGLMRYMLYNSDENKVGIDQEINYLRDFVALEKLRLGDKVRVEFSCETIDESRGIEPMLLIPFVENAFKHGTGRMSQPEVWIRLRMTGPTFWFNVRNKISPFVHSPVDDSSGIGLKNVQRRLNLLYPDHHLDITRDNGWFEIILLLTLR